MDDIITEDIKIATSLNNDTDTGANENMVINIADSDGEISETMHHPHSHHHHSHHHHSHHHHGSHSHSGKHYSRRNKKDNKIVRFIKKHRNALINLSIILFVGVLFFCVLLWVEKSDEKEQFPVSDIAETKGYIRIETSLYSEEVCIMNPAVSAYMNSAENVKADKFYKNFNGSKNRLDTALPVRFSYTVTGIPAGVSVEFAELEVSEFSSYMDAQKIVLENKNDAVDVYLLKSGTQYYYRLNLTLSDGALAGSCGSFKTAVSPRFMNVDGAYNMRDIGGWTTLSGKKVKQGLLYRGTEIDGAIETKYCLTEKGIEQMRSVLKIKTDMDLRTKVDTPKGKDVLGNDIKHIYYGVTMYDTIFREQNYEGIRRVFSDLADKSNYPVYMHCTYGRDRTGTVCYILEALLGLSDKDLRREYDLSALNDGFSDLESFAGLTTMLSMYEGATTQEKAENYLLSIGVTVDEIASIRRIFLGE